MHAEAADVRKMVAKTRRTDVVYVCDMVSLQYQQARGRK